MNRWIGIARYVYNKTLDDIRSGEKINFRHLRDRNVTAKNNSRVQDWEVECPKDIRAGAVEDLVSAHKSCFTKGDKFKMRYRSKKSKTSCIHIPKSSVTIEKKSFTVYPKYKIGAIRLSRDKALKDITSLEHDSKIYREHNKWYLLIPIKVYTSSIDSDVPCALDPGVRNFQTVYSDISTARFGINKVLLRKLQEKIDLSRSLRDRGRLSHSRYKRKVYRLYTRLDNLINDMHYRVIDYLSNRFSTVFIPSFETQKMTMKSRNRFLNRNILSLKHYLFKKRLVEKYSLIRNGICIPVTEEYTSRTCTRCGTLNNIGSSDTLKCENCNLTINRDINGARNILLKSLSELFP